MAPPELTPKKPLCVHGHTFGCASRMDAHGRMEVPTEKTN